MTNFLRLPGSGATCTTPDAPPLDITGDLDIRCAAALDDWTPAAGAILVRKWSGPTAGNFSYDLTVVASTGVLQLAWSNDGSAIPLGVSTVAPTVSDGALLLVRATLDVDNGAAGRDIKFFTKTSTPSSAASDLVSDTGWTQLGTTITQAGVTSIFNSNNVAAVGNRNDGTIPTAGKFYAAVIKNGIEGTTVAFPDFTTQPIGTTSFSDGASRTWTLAGGALITGPVLLELVTETDEVLPFDTDTVDLGLVTETDTVFELVDQNIVLLALVTETDTVFPIVNSVTVEIGLVTEQDSVTTIVPRSAADPSFRLGLGPRLVTLGCGSYQCFVTRRGGSPVVLEVAFTQIQIQHVVDNAGTCTISLPEVSASSGAACCEVVEKTEPWRDELLVYRDRDIAFVGPVTLVDGDSGSLAARDLFHWTEKRFVDDDLHYWGDTAFTFGAVFKYAMDKDSSPNIEEVIVHPSGVSSIRDYNKNEVVRAADALRELARTAVDFTMVNRTLYVGGKEVFSPESVPGVPLLLPDQAVLKAAVVKDGDGFATDVAVFAGSKGDEKSARTIPLVGRATRQTEVYGLVQAVATELLINDLESANQNALSRLESMQPAPLRVHVVFSPDAPFEFNDIIPGRRVDSRLSATSCIDVIDLIRLANVNITASAEGETIEGDLIPLGEFENA